MELEPILPPQEPVGVLENPHHLSKRWRFLVLILGIALIVGGSFFFMSHTPSDFVPGTTVMISPGTSVKEAGDLLEQNKIIRSSSLFQFVIKMFLQDRPVIAGEFSFEEPRTLRQIILRVTDGAFGKTQVKLTFPEGVTIREIAAITQKNIPAFNSDEFVAKASSYEGYLFPETYLVFKTLTPDELIQKMNKEYLSRTKKLFPQDSPDKRRESSVIIMASLLEREARNEEEAQMIAGILAKRIEKGIPLQVDAPFMYLLNKTSSQLTVRDLQKDGPYNTYTRKGLPVGPIGNPGMSMINAALHPKASAYLYYLHDKEGIIHYAKTYEEHLANKNRYLK
jgi:UPF0755 protein